MIYLFIKVRDNCELERDDLLTFAAIFLGYGAVNQAFRYFENKKQNEKGKNNRSGHSDSNTTDTLDDAI